MQKEALCTQTGTSASKSWQKRSLPMWKRKKIQEMLLKVTRLSPFSQLPAIVLDNYANGSDLDSRKNLFEGSLMAGMAFANAGATAVRSSRQLK